MGGAVVTDPNLLVVELFREGEEIKKRFVSDGPLSGETKPTLGKSAVLAAMAMLAESQALQPGDRLTVRVPIEGEDIPTREEE
jgi:hypothetical protein